LNLHHISQPCTEVLHTVECFQQAKEFCLDSIILGIKLNCPNTASGATMGAVGYPASPLEQCSSTATQIWYNMFSVCSSNSLFILLHHSHLTKTEFHQRQNAIN